MLTQVQKKAITDKVEACFVKYEAHTKTTVKRATEIRFDLRGGTAGTADPRSHVLNFNAALAVRVWDDTINNTVPHEVAHLIDFEVNNKVERNQLARMRAIENMMLFGKRRKMPKRDLHGASWKAVMHVLGVVATRCHQIDTTGIVKRKARHEYLCLCGATVVLGPKHNSAVTKGRRVKHIACGNVLTAAMYVAKRKPPVAAVPPAQVPEPKAPAAPRAGTKMDQAITIVATHGGMTANEVINVLMRNLNMTRAGAQTYYYAAKKRI